MRPLVDRGHASLTIRRQCELLGLARSTLYYEPATESSRNLALMRLIDEAFLRHPFYGSRQMTAWLNRTAFSRRYRMRASNALAKLLGCNLPRLTQDPLKYERGG